jgi:MFS family permease
MFAVMVTSPFFLDAASFALSAVLVLSMRGSFRAKGAKNSGTSSMWTEIAEGFRWLWANRLLRSLAVILGVWNLLQTAYFAVFVLYALEILQLQPSVYGVLLAVYAIGSLGGSFIARKVSARFGPGPTLIACMVAGAITALTLGITSSAILAAAALMLDGVGGIVWNIVTISLRQEIIPDALLGRVSADFRFIGMGSLPVGALLGGILARAFGLRFPFLLTGVCIAGMTLAALPILNNHTIEAARIASAVGEEYHDG